MNASRLKTFVTSAISLLFFFSLQSYAQGTGSSLVVDDTGKVGVGTDTPEAALHVLQDAGTYVEALRLENNSGSFFSIENSGSGRTWYFINQASGTPAGSNFIIATGAGGPLGFPLILTPDGNLLISGNLISTAKAPKGLKLPDYVFDEGYELMPLKDVAVFIEKEKHLPNIPSNEEVEKAGQLNLNEMQLSLLEKVEELFLHAIDQEARIDQLQAENEALRETTNVLVQRLDSVRKLEGADLETISE